MIKLKNLISENQELDITDIKRVKRKIKAFLDSYSNEIDGNMDVEFLELLRDTLISDIDERIMVLQKMQDDSSRVTIKGFRQ